ncbi:MAG: hypothetical protein PVJ80_16490 [Gemmatimonadota bacterium]
MRPLPRWQRRAAALWVGIVAAWAAVLVVGYIRSRERFTPILVGSAAIAIVGGALRTAWLRRQDSEPVITVEDLRKG